MRPQATRSMMKMHGLLEALAEDDQRSVVYELYRTYGGPLTGMSKPQAGRLGGGKSSEARRVLHDAAGGVLDHEAQGVLHPEAGCVQPSKPLDLVLDSGLEQFEPFEESRRLLDAKDFAFLSSCPEPFKTQWLKDPEWWISVKDGYPRVSLQGEASKCMSYVQGKFSPKQQGHLNLRERFRRWVSKAEAWRETRDERKAVRG